MLYKPEPSPINEPVKYDALISFVTFIEPVKVRPVLITNPLSGDIDAVTDPLDI
jgi:hypothetical protein